MTENTFRLVWPYIDAVPGWMSPGQEKCLFDLVSSLPNNARIIELGSFLGRSTVTMAFASRGTDRQIYAIDTFEGNKDDFKSGANKVHWQGNSFLGVFQHHVDRNGLTDLVTPLKGWTNEIAKHWSTQVDMIFIDAGHTYEAVKEDVELYYDHVKPGGIVALHDVTPSWPGVERVWNEIVAPRLENIGNKGSLYYGIKPTHKVEKVDPVDRWLSDDEQVMLNILNDSLGHKNSRERKFCVNNRNKLIPNYTYPALEYLNDLDFSQKTIFEYGTSAGSIYWAGRAKKVVSVETNKTWYDKIKISIKSNQSLLYRPEEADYVSELKQHGKVDLVVLQGETAAKVIEFLPHHLNEGGLIILNNAPHYPDVAEALREEGYLQVDMKGFGPIQTHQWCTSLFFDRGFSPQPSNKHLPSHGLGSKVMVDKKG